MFLEFWTKHITYENLHEVPGILNSSFLCVGTRDQKGELSGQILSDVLKEIF